MVNALFDAMHGAFHVVVDVVCPSLYRDALSLPQAKQWKISMWVEINALGNSKEVLARRQESPSWCLDAAWLFRLQNQDEGQLD